MADPLKDILQVLIPGALSAGGTALANQGRRQRQQVNPLLGFIQGAGPQIQNLIARSQATGQERERIGEQSEFLTGQFPKSIGPEWVTSALEAGVSPGDILKRGEQAQKGRTQAFGRATVDEALRGRTGEGETAEFPGPGVGEDPADFWQDIRQGFPGLSPAMFGDQPNIPFRGMGIEEMTKAAFRLDPTQTAEQHGERLQTSIPGQLAAYGDQLRAMARSKGQTLNPGEYQQLMQRKMAELQGMPTDFGQEDLLDPMGERAAAEQEEEKFQLGQTRGEEQRLAENERKMELLRPILPGLSEEELRALAGGVSPGLIPGLQKPEKPKDQSKPLRDEYIRQKTMEVKSVAGFQAIRSQALVNTGLTERNLTFADPNSSANKATVKEEQKRITDSTMTQITSDAWRRYGGEVDVTQVEKEEELRRLEAEYQKLQEQYYGPQR